jgi:hypothetical protein
MTTRQQEQPQEQGVVAGLEVFIPPIAKCAMDGAPRHFATTETEAKSRSHSGMTIRTAMAKAKSNAEWQRRKATQKEIVFVRGSSFAIE